MQDSAEEGERALKRMLANGPLTALPKRPQDQDLLALMAAARFTPGPANGEGEVNDVLAAWLATFSAPYGIDHVTLRRMMVDARLLTRTPSGSTYGVNGARADEIAAVAHLVQSAMLEAVQAERERRKREHRA